MPWIEDEFDEEFRQWILNFPKDSLPTIFSLLEKYRNEKFIYIFKTREEINTYLNRLSSPTFKLQKRKWREWDMLVLAGSEIPYG